MKVTDVIPPFPERVRASQNFGSRILGAGQRPCQVCFRRDRFGEQVLRDFAEMRRQPTPASNCATLKTLARAVQDSAIGGPSRTPGFPSAAPSCSRFRPALTGRLGVTTTPRLCPTPGSCTRNTGSDAMSDAWTLLVEIFDTRAAGQSDRFQSSLARSAAANARCDHVHRHDAVRRRRANRHAADRKGCRGRGRDQRTRRPRVRVPL